MALLLTPSFRVKLPRQHSFSAWSYVLQHGYWNQSRIFKIQNHTGTTSRISKYGIQCNSTTINSIHSPKLTADSSTSTAHTTHFNLSTNAHLYDLNYQFVEHEKCNIRELWVIRNESDDEEQLLQKSHLVFAPTHPLTNTNASIAHWNGLVGQ